MSQTLGRRSRFHIPLFILAALLFSLYALLEVPLRDARAKWREGRPGEAMVVLERWRRLRMRPDDFDAARAVIFLSAGKRDEAAPLLAATARRQGLFSLFDEAEVGRYLVARGRYAEFLDYRTAISADSDEMDLYAAAALAASGRVDEASAAFGRVDDDDVDESEYAAVRGAIEQRKAGSYPLVVDRDGKTIAVVQGSTHDVVAVNRDFAPLVEKEAGRLTLESQLTAIGSDRQLLTTLDSRIQRAAVFALGGFEGSIVVVDVEKNEIAAIASNSPRGGMNNLAIEATYEPGSVIKVLTTMRAADEGVAFAKFFPARCEGLLTLNGRVFHDWARHDVVRDVNEALAISCNVAFARLAAALGREKVAAMLDRSRFGDEADFRLLSFPLGRRNGVIGNDYAAASAACGLEFETINALHLALLAHAVARHGSAPVPRLFSARRSILGDAEEVPAPSEKIELASQSAAAVAIEAMKAVVVHPRGTGRRAAVEGVSIAMKTGTAGQREPAYNAVVMAFAPADKPRYAVGMIAVHAGPAEFAGAKIIHDFFAQALGGSGN